MITLLGTIAFSGLLMNFLYAVLVLAIIGGLLYCVDYFIYPVPPPIKLVIAIIAVIIVVLKMLGGA